MTFALYRRQQLCRKLASQRWRLMKEENLDVCIRSISTTRTVSTASFPSTSCRAIQSFLPVGYWRQQRPGPFFFSTTPTEEILDTEDEAVSNAAGGVVSWPDSAAPKRKQWEIPNRFEDLDLHPKTLKALRRQGLHRLTEVQQQTFDVIRSGRNVVARSRTGTGKTLAFLVPAVERILKEEEQRQGGARTNLDSPNGVAGVTTRPHSSSCIKMLIIVPTRELALQIHHEVEKLLCFHSGRTTAIPSTLTSQVLYGGSSKEQDIRQFHRSLPTILVATPGRLKDHLATTTLTYVSRDNGDTTTMVHVPFRKCLQSLQTLVLDETDHLLAMGFRRDITDILSSIPVNNAIQRQTLLFSATLPEEVLEVVDLAMPQQLEKKVDNGSRDHLSIPSHNYQLIDCIQESDPTTHTNEKTLQSYMVLSSERFWKGSMEYILELLEGSNQKKKNKKESTKVIVFFPMTRLVQLYYKFFAERLGCGRVWELHGKMHQRDRTVVARRFRNTPSGLLLTSDVSARGVDYPDVTHVVQVGAAPSRETYIHRLGRCGRAGKKGEGMLILPEMEQDFLHELEGLQIDACDDTAIQRVLQPSNRQLENELGVLKQDLRLGNDPTEIEMLLHLAYHSLISYHFQSRRDKEQPLDQVVSTLNQLIQDFGLTGLPPIDSKRAKKMDIDQLAGLNIRKDWDDVRSWNQDLGEGDEASGSGEFQRKRYGEFDDWFGVNDSPTQRTARPTQSKMSHSRQMPQRPNTSDRGGQKDQGTNHNRIRASNGPKRTAHGKFKDSFRTKRLDKFQRWDFPGESLEKE